MDLSEQYMVECTYDSDCEGSIYVEYSMYEIIRKGVPHEETYPYDPFNTYPGISSTSDRVVISD